MIVITIKYEKYVQIFRLTKFIILINQCGRKCQQPAKPKPKTIEGTTKGVKRKLTTLLTAIVKNERERIPYYAEITGLSAKSIERYIRQLRNASIYWRSSSVNKIVFIPNWLLKVV